MTLVPHSSDQPEMDAPQGDPVSPLAEASAFLEELKEAALARANHELEIESQYQAAGQALKRASREDAEKHDEWLRIERHDVTADYAEMRRHALARFTRESGQVEQELTALHEEVAKQFETADTRAAQQRKDARWEAETLFDAARHLPPRRLREFEHNLETWMTRLQDEREQAQLLLEAWHQTWVDESAENAPAEPPLDEHRECVTRMQERVHLVASQRASLAQLSVPPLAVNAGLYWLYGLIGIALAALAVVVGAGPIGAVVGILLGSAIGVATSIYLQRLARAQVAAVYPALHQAAEEAEALAERARVEARERAEREMAELIERRDQSLREAEQRYQSLEAEAVQRRDTTLQRAAVDFPARLAELTARRDRDLQLADADRDRRQAEIDRRQAVANDADDRFARQTQQIEERRAAQSSALVEEWRSTVARLKDAAERLHRTDTTLAGTTLDGTASSNADRWLADWSALAGQSWPPAAAIPPAIRFGEYRLPMKQIPHGVPERSSMREMTPADFKLPALTKFPDRPSMLFRVRDVAGRRAAIECMQAVMLRLLVAIPPGKVRMTIIDPVGLGENFAAFMHLADFNEALITNRIWTDPRHIEQRLADLSEHMENVIQKYLRNEFESIEEYNRFAGEIAEPFRFVVAADFPANFSEAAQRRLLSIAHSGPRCGVYVLLLANAREKLATEISLDDFRHDATTLTWDTDHSAWLWDGPGHFMVTTDRPPEPAQVTEILQLVGTYANRADKVQVPFEIIAPRPDELWTGSTRTGIDVPLGRAGATRLQHMKLGHGTSQHVLVAGKTGSGKSTLLHALVTNLALRYSPAEIEMYLVDFKQGVEFKTYATHQLPHARVVAIESDREFGLSVLERLDAELKSRADRFRALGVQDLAGFRQADPGTAMPRILLVVDEFQEFFVEDDKIAQDVALLLDRLVRQGRAFGIHLLMGSQTLAGTYTLARSTIGQMAVRIALQCSEGDAHLILSEENSAARLLSRPGEAIYNDSNGLVEGNHPFQIAWLGDDRREVRLAEIRELAASHGYTAGTQVIFEGNIPADPARNELLAEQLDAKRPLTATAERAWLGDAVAIKEPTSVTFRRQSGSNLLIVGQNEDAALGILSTALVSLASSVHDPQESRTRFYILDGSTPGSGHAASLARLVELPVEPAKLTGWRQLAATVNELAAEVRRRHDQPEAEQPPIYVLAHGVQKLRDLRRQEDDFSFSRGGEERPPDPARQFGDILKDGPVVGVHVLAWVDSVTNLHRTWDRQSLREFQMRAVFQMSANDSSTLLDTPAASRLGVNRALLHNEEESVLEKFRPYRWPGDEWLEQVRRQLQARDGTHDNRSERLVV